MQLDDLAVLKNEGTAVPYERFRFRSADWHGIRAGTPEPRPPALIDFDPEKPLPISLPRAA